MGPCQSLAEDYRDSSQLQRGDVFIFLSDPAQVEYLVLRVREGRSTHEESGVLVYYVPNRVTKEPASYGLLYRHLRLLCCPRERTNAMIVMIVAHRSQRVKHSAVSL